MSRIVVFTQDDQQFVRELRSALQRHGLSLVVAAAHRTSGLTLDDEAAAALVDHAACGTNATIQVIADVRRGRPEIPIVVLVEGQSVGHADLARIARSGADDVIVVQQREGLAEAAQFMIRAAKHRLPRAFVEELIEVVPSNVRPIVSWTLRRAWHDVSVHDFRFFGVDRKTIYRRLMRSRAPSTHAVIQLCRLAYVCRELDGTLLTQSVAAHKLSFHTDSSLRMMVYRAFREPITSLRGEATQRLRLKWYRMFGR